MPENAEPKQPLSFCRNDDVYLELVRKRAYDLYLERGMEDGHDVEDWLRAEEQVLSVNEKAIAAAA